MENPTQQHFNEPESQLANSDSLPPYISELSRVTLQARYFVWNNTDIRMITKVLALMQTNLPFTNFIQALHQGLSGYEIEVDLC